MVLGKFIGKKAMSMPVSARISAVSPVSPAI
jgi:hypothetical protein